MTGLDWLIVVIVLLSILLAAAQGFFFEIFSLAGAVLGYLLAAWEYPQMARRLLPYVKEAWVADIAGFLSIFFLVLLIAGFAARLARWVMKEAGLQWVDRLLGASFGLVRGVVVATVLVLALAAFLPESRLLARSTLAPYFLVPGRAAVWLAPASVRQKFRDGVRAVRDLGAPGPRPAEPPPPPGTRPADED